MLPVGGFILAVGVDLGSDKNHNKENNEGNLTGCEFHIGYKGNARLSNTYF